MLTKILVIDDDSNITDLLKMYLEKEGYEVKTAADGQEGLTTFKMYEPDLVLLDVMLPRKDGLQICREIRDHSSKPVIMISAKGETFDKVLGLELGADDYIVKPLDMKEVFARVKAVLRRVNPVPAAKVLAKDGLVLDPAGHTVTADGERIELTFKEFELLKLFLSNPGIAFTRDGLMEKVWGVDYLGETRTVDMHIRTLRQKLGKYGELIGTVRGVGYRLETK